MHLRSCLKRSFVRHLTPLGLLALCAMSGVDAHEGHGQSVERMSETAKASVRYAGTIVDLTVESLDGHVFHFPRLALDGGRSVGLLDGPIVEQLHAGDRVIVSGRLNGQALGVDALESRAPATVAKEMRAGGRTTGILEILHADDFEHGVAHFSYRVRGDDERVVALDIDALPAMLRGGMQVDVEGEPQASGFAPQHIVITADAPDATAGDKADAKSASVHTVLVIMANFNNTAAPSFTAAQAQQVMVSNTGSVANFYNEVSFGQHQLSVTVTNGWLTLNYAKPTCVDADLGGFTTAARNAATAAGYNLSGYEFVVYLFPSLSCGWSGLGYIGAPRYAYINGPGSFVTSVVGHEMGHNFGLLHAGSLRCTGSVGGTCSVSEYGDPFDVMGNQHAGHFNAMQKSLLGWIAAGTTPTHNGGSITYTLSPIETGGGSTYAVKIPTPLSTRTYWLEYRQPIGFDNWGAWVSNGAQIRLENPFETYCSTCGAWSDDTELVDATPGTSSFTDAALTVGASYTDPDYPVTFNVIGASPSTLTVQVVTPSSAGSTTTTLASSMNPAPVGTSVTFTATVSGSAPTGTVAFKDGANVIGGCATITLTGTGNSRTASCTISTLSAGAHGIAAVYSGDSGNATSTSTVLTESVTTGGWLGYLSGGNIASGSGSAVAAGTSNVASGQASFVGAGQSNSANGVSSLVIGGFDNHATAIDSFVGAGAGNRAAGARSVVVGGGYNLASGQWSFIGGGGRETGSGTAGTSSQDNAAIAKWSTVLGGNGNRAGSQATQSGATVGGGERNQALNTDATVAGGNLNTATATYSAVGGGQSNASNAGNASIGGGLGNWASATSATIPGGSTNVASANFAFAAGQRASSVNPGSIAFADSSAFTFSTTASNQFNVRASGGVRLITGINASNGTPTAGVAVAAGGGSWTTLSDRASKRDFTNVDQGELLASIASLPVYTWRYITERSGALHLGPTAQDFRAAFELGDSERRITTVDASGVALATLKALQQRVAARDALIESRARQLARLRERLSRLDQKLANRVSLRGARAREPHPPVHSFAP